MHRHQQAHKYTTAEKKIIIADKILILKTLIARCIYWANQLSSARSPLFCSLWIQSIVHNFIIIVSIWFSARLKTFSNCIDPNTKLNCFYCPRPAFCLSWNIQIAKRHHFMLNQNKPHKIRHSVHLMQSKKYYYSSVWKIHRWKANKIHIFITASISNECLSSIVFDECNVFGAFMYYIFINYLT